MGHSIPVRIKPQVFCQIQCVAPLSPSFPLHPRELFRHLWTTLCDFYRLWLIVWEESTILRNFVNILTFLFLRGKVEIYFMPLNVVEENSNEVPDVAQDQALAKHVRPWVPFPAP